MKRVLMIGGIVLLGIVLVAGAVLLSGHDLLAAAAGLVQGAFGSPSAFGGTLREATPLLIAGLAAFVALKAGLFNIGVDGQLVVGALSATVIALRMPGPLGVVLGTLAALVAGALWAAPAGLIRAYRGGHEVISTIMLNRIAVLATNALVAGPFLDRTAGSATTASLPVGSMLPNLLSTPLTITLAIPIGIVLVVLAGLWLGKTVSGYELRAVGANPRAALFAGVESPRVTVRAMLLSGAIAGFAGAMLVFTDTGRFYTDFSPGYGFDALGVALLAGPIALGVIPAALVFGALAKGGTALAIDGIPKSITTVVLGVLILIAGAIRFSQGRARG
ncbi:ABC transporter permease [bacterium]|nr:MAG: ABC transporter permease [bacterium]